MSKTPFMKMELPVPGSTPAGEWGGKLNRALEEHVDVHDHSDGRGRPIAPRGMHIDETLPMNNNELSNAKAVGFVDGSGIPNGTGKVFVKDGDLHFVDAYGRVVQLTEDGQVLPGREGNILDLAPPAEVRYSAIEQTFSFLDNASQGIRAMLDVGSIKLRALVQGAKRILIKSPPGLADDYELTLPGSLPSAKRVVHLDEAGVLSAEKVGTDVIGDGAVTPVKLQGGEISENWLADGAVTTKKLAPSNFQMSQSCGEDIHGGEALGMVPVPNMSVTVQATAGRPILVLAQATNPLQSGYWSSRNVGSSNEQACVEVRVFTQGSLSGILPVILAASKTDEIYRASTLSLVYVPSQTTQTTFTAYFGSDDPEREAKVAGASNMRLVAVEF